MFYKILNFPKLPEYLVTQILEIVKDTKNMVVKEHQNHSGYDEYRNRTLHKTNGDVVTSVLAQRYQLTQELEHWLTTNVHPTPRRQNISFYNNVSDSMGPHVDHERDEVWLYLLQSGGPKVETVWYQEQGFSVVRKDMQTLENSYMDCTQCNYKKLIELARFQIPLHTWVSINSSIIHSVEGIVTNRLAIQITP
jgi:hypothetical protein